MKNKMKDLLYNPGSIATAGESLEELPNQLGQAELAILDSLENLVLAHTEQEALLALKRFEICLAENGQTLKLRQLILSEFNRVIKRLSKLFPNHDILSSVALSATSQFRQTSFNSGSGIIDQSEWVELERVIVTLTEWQENTCGGTSQAMH